MVSHLYSFVHRLGFYHRADDVAKGVFDFGIVYTEADDGFYLLAYESHQLVIVVAFIYAAYNPDDGFFDAFQGVVDGVGVGGFGVVDVRYLF